MQLLGQPRVRLPDLHRIQMSRLPKRLFKPNKGRGWLSFVGCVTSEIEADNDAAAMQFGDLRSGTRTPAARSGEVNQERGGRGCRRKSAAEKLARRSPGLALPISPS